MNNLSNSKKLIFGREIEGYSKSDYYKNFNMPKYKTPNGIDIDKYFEEICDKQLKLKYGNNIPKKVIARYEKEKSHIIKVGFAEYFLHYWDIVNWAKNNNISFGLGRGSAVGSLICYILDFTKIDPIKYNLIFERFLNNKRIGFPDIVLDVTEQDKEKLINHLFEKFGNNNIIIYNDLVLLNQDEKDKKSWYNELYLYINDKPILDVTGLSQITKNIYTANIPFSKLKAECIKFVIVNSLEEINKSQIDIDKIPLNDKNTFKKIRKGEIEKENYCDFDLKLLKSINPKNIEELTAFYVLNRNFSKTDVPNNYINAKKSKNKVYNKLLKPIIKNTYGEIIYDEQIIQILNVIGGFSLDEGEIIRQRMYRVHNRVHNRKHYDSAIDEDFKPRLDFLKNILDDNQQKFLNNAKLKGFTEEEAMELWDKLCANAYYCFMKSHAVSEALSAYLLTYIRNREF